MTRTSATLALVFLVLASCAWSLLIVAAPFLSSRSPSSSVATFVGGSAYLVGGLICHQQPHRSFHLHGVQLPVCSRCAGLYWAGTAGLLLVLAAHLAGRTKTVLGNGARGWLLLAAIPTAITVVAESLSWWHPSGTVRAIAALPLGLVAGVLTGQTLSFRGKLSRCERILPNGPGRAS